MSHNPIGQTARERRLIGALRFIACCSTAYHSQGPAVVAREACESAYRVLQEEWSRQESRRQRHEGMI